MKETGSISLRLGFTKRWEIPTPPLFYTIVFTNQHYLFLLNEGIREIIHLLIIEPRLLYIYNIYLLHTYTYLLLYTKRVREKWQYKLTNPKYLKHIFKFMPPIVKNFLSKQTYISFYRHNPIRLLIPTRFVIDTALSKEAGFLWTRKQAHTGHVGYKRNIKNKLAKTFDLFRHKLYQYRSKILRRKKIISPIKRKSKRPKIYKIRWPQITKLSLFYITPSTQTLVYNKNLILHQTPFKPSNSQTTRTRLRHLYRIDKFKRYHPIFTFNKPHLLTHEQPIKATWHIRYRNHLYLHLSKVAFEFCIQDKLNVPVTVVQRSLWNAYLSGKQSYQQTKTLIKTFRLFIGLALKRIFIYDIILIAYHCLFFRNPHTLVVFITHELARTKYHRFVIYFFTRQLLNNLVLCQSTTIRVTHGFSCALYGPIGKHGRTKKILFTCGNKPRGKFELITVSGRSEANTFYGTLGLRLWMY